ncbi:MAG TPA: hypothetical protein VIG08_12215 [Gemmatimonadales bacterium]|jgi:hypothetical protein
MRNYWIKILVGALVIFAVGMLGVTLVRHGMVKVNDVVHGSGPISIPLAIIPFEIGGTRLGTLSRVVLERTAPKEISSVRVEVDMNDTLVAQGLSECRLAANFDASREPSKGVQIHTGRKNGGTFRCLTGTEADTTLEEFGQAVLKPGNVTLPLLLPKELVTELQSGAFLSDSSDSADSLADAMQALRDSIETAQESKMDSLRDKLDSLKGRNGRLAESLRVVGRRRIDSLKQAALQLADSAKAASLKADASRPR